METIDKALSYLDKLQGLPGVALVFLSAIVIGYAWRFIPAKWFPNQAIPVAVIVWGAFAMSLIADARASTMPLRVWILRNLIIGAVIGFAAWLTHNLILSRIEDWLGSKSAAVDRLLNPDKNTPAPSPEPTPKP